MGGKCISILLVGIGGYGQGYVEEILKYEGEKIFEVVGVVDPFPQNCKYIEKIKELNIPIYSTIEEFYAVSKADLAVISSPIQYHCSQVCTALANGSNVLCEKPISATVQEARAMMDAQKKYGKIVAIGYQWSHSNEILALKHDIQNGLFGKPLRFKTMVLWPRDHKYFSRGWAAKKMDKDGRWILDSVANNATAHYLHNMFYLLGDKTDSSALPVNVTAELYRANDIENYDTAAVRTMTDKGVELLFLATHAVIELKDPIFQFEFENAVVTYDGNQGRFSGIKAVFKDGSVKEYGKPDGSRKKLWMAIDSVREGKPVVCGLEAAYSHTLCINGMQDSMPDIQDFPQEYIRYDDVRQITWVEGLAEVMKECFKEWKLPSELNVPWAKAGREIDLRNYTEFKGR